MEGHRGSKYMFETLKYPNYFSLKVMILADIAQ